MAIKERVEPETHTLQVWPSGRGYAYHGHPARPDLPRQLRAHHFNGELPEPWRDGQPDEWREILHEVRAERYQEHEIYHCDSMLVGDLIQHADGLGTSGHNLAEAFSLEEIRNLYPDPYEWNRDRCLDYCRDYGLVIAFKETTDDELRDAVRDNAEPAEVFEWWRVSEWLCNQLHAIGEVTLDNGYGHWWGRQCTGQQFIMDGTLQRVAAQFDDE